MNKTITFVSEFKDGNDIFKSNYLSALLLSYKALNKEGAKECNELGKVVTAILQLQIGALGEKLTRRINDGVFEKRDDDLDILEDLGDIIQLNYQSVGMSGFKAASPYGRERFSSRASFPGHKKCSRVNHESRRTYRAEGLRISEFRSIRLDMLHKQNSCHHDGSSCLRLFFGYSPGLIDKERFRRSGFYFSQ